MINFDEFMQDFLEESRQLLAGIETDLLAIELGGVKIEEGLVDRVLRALHWVAVGAGSLELMSIRELAHGAARVVALIRSRRITPSDERVSVLLHAIDALDLLMENPDGSNQAGVTALMEQLARLCADDRASAQYGKHQVHRPRPAAGQLRALLVEDDFSSRLVLHSFLSRYGQCDVATNGREAVDAFRIAMEAGRSYDLICMDVMMPEMDGREAVRQIRDREEAAGTVSTYGAKIVMTTAVDELKEVSLCFRELCDAYLVKPIDLSKLLCQMKSYQLVS
jgi:two-component system, chemotaxis family, chemotaxis protein CheY